MIFAAILEIVMSRNDLLMKFFAHITTEAVIPISEDFRV